MHPDPAATHVTSFAEVKSLDLVRQFILELTARYRAYDGTGVISEIDMNALRNAMQGARSPEQAIGRAVVLANRMAQAGGMISGTPSGTYGSPVDSRMVQGATSIQSSAMRPATPSWTPR